MFHSRAISVEDGATHYLFGSLPEHCETTFHVDDIILADKSYIMVAVHPIQSTAIWVIDSLYYEVRKYLRKQPLFKQYTVRLRYSGRLGALQNEFGFENIRFIV